MNILMAKPFPKVSRNAELTTAVLREKQDEEWKLFRGPCIRNEIKNKRCFSTRRNKRHKRMERRVGGLVAYMYTEIPHILHVITYASSRSCSFSSLHLHLLPFFTFLTYNWSIRIFFNIPCSRLSSISPRIGLNAVGNLFSNYDLQNGDFLEESAA